MLKIYEYKDITSNEALKLALKNHQIDSYIIIYNSYGKPYLKNNEVYFNISHTKNVIKIAISDKEVGIDIEYKCYKPKVISRCFNEKEIELINSSRDKEDTFTTIWVKKEAYVKMIGQGLGYGLKNVDTTKLVVEVKKNENLYTAVCVKK